MRGLIRSRQWQPVFITPGGRRTIFFYSGAEWAGSAAFFHHHHGDTRPHLHVIEGYPPEYHQHHEHQDGPAHRIDSGTHAHVQSRHHHEPIRAQCGHWHFALPEPASGHDLRSAYFFQVFALGWVIATCGSPDQADDLRLALDYWARPPP